MERNRLGQFATPPALAEQIASIALTYHPPGPVRFLEPSVGAGAFYDALLAACPAGRIASARGVEVDPRFAAAARRLWRDRGLAVTEGDFTSLRATAAPADRATLVLANPPYSRHHHLDAAQKAAIQAKLQAAGLGGGLSGLSGLYLYFVLLADAWAAPGCVSAWLLPSEWMDVNYGAALKAYLQGRVRLLRIHRFEAEDMQFGEAMVTSSVVFFRHAPPDPSATVLLTAGSLPAPTLRREVFCSALQPSQKWGTLFRAAPAPVADPVAVPPALQLREFLFIKNRSRATAANSWLLLSPTPRLTALLQTQPDAPDRLLGFLQARTAKQLADQGRTYGGGLSKLEPKELASLDISDLAAILSSGDQTC